MGHCPSWDGLVVPRSRRSNRAWTDFAKLSLMLQGPVCLRPSTLVAPTRPARTHMDEAAEELLQALSRHFITASLVDEGFRPGLALRAWSYVRRELQAVIKSLLASPLSLGPARSTAFVTQVARWGIRPSAVWYRTLHDSEQCTGWTIMHQILWRQCIKRSRVPSPLQQDLPLADGFQGGALGQLQVDARISQAFYDSFALPLTSS
ncbi:hypothetical protein BV20DRAFT_620596 [Pilatotrama ljubarskyi]|nr:hypothetical protein BV20DRAFT_620596 [Pilatotrama ljubarskyi]